MPAASWTPDDARRNECHAPVSPSVGGAKTLDDSACVKDERLGFNRMPLRQIVRRLPKINRPRVTEDRPILRFDPRQQPRRRVRLRSDFSRHSRVPDARQRQDDVPLVVRPVLRLVLLGNGVEQRTREILAWHGFKKLVGGRADDRDAVAQHLCQNDGEVVVLHGRLHDARQQILA